MTRLQAVVLTTATLAAGCFSPDYGNGGFACSANGKCPDGYQCAANSKCYPPGHAPMDDLSVDVDMTEAQPGDMAMPGDMPRLIKHQGQACGVGDTCDTGNCVDGYCCNSNCTGTCQACNVAGLEGSCSNVSSGAAPVGTRVCGAQLPSTCGLDGMCDGAGACRRWANGTVCAPGTCTVATGDFTAPSTCNGAGTCVAGASSNCTPYNCQDATQCNSTCSGNAQCSGANMCVNGSCGKLANGRTCAGGNGALCVSGNCVDGVCCDSPCTGSCQACDVAGNIGACTTDGAGLPHGTRTCTNQGVAPCGGTCNGTTSTCTYAATSVACGSVCSTGTKVQKSFCNAAGTCSAAAPTTCANNLICVGTDCLSSCVNDPADCVTGYGCPAGGVCKKYCVYDTDNYDTACIYAP